MIDIIGASSPIGIVGLIARTPDDFPGGDVGYDEAAVCIVSFANIANNHHGLVLYAASTVGRNSLGGPVGPPDYIAKFKTSFEHLESLSRRAPGRWIS